MSIRENSIPKTYVLPQSAAKWKIAALLLILGFVVLFAWIFIDTRFRDGLGWHAFDSAAVVTQVKQLNQLVTVRYSIQRVVGITEPKEPFGAESILLMVQGEALAGVDLAGMTPRDIVYSGERSVTVTLPKPRIFNAFLDEKQTKVWDRHITWWTPWVPYDPDLEHRARLSAVKDVRDAALAMGILEQAQKNAESAIRDFLRALKIDACFKARAG